MADETEMDIKIGGDAGDLEGAAEDSVEALSTLVAAIKSLTATQGEQAASSDAESSALVNLAHAAVEAKAAFLEAKDGLAELGEALLSVFAVEQISEFVNKTAELSEKQEQLSETLGMSQSQWQGWATVAQLTGRDADQLGMAFERLYRNAIMGGAGSKLQGEALKNLGISAKDAKDPTQLLYEVADKFHDLADTPRNAALKLADAMALMGRAGGRWVPILSLGSQALKGMADKGKELGTVLSGDMNEGLNKLAEQGNELKAAWAGLGNTLVADLAPSITTLVKNITAMVVGFREWSESGNNLRIMLTGLTVALGAMAAIMGAGLLGAAIEGLIGLFESLKAAIVLVIPELVEFDVAADANPFGAIAIGVELLVAGLILLYMWLDKIGAITQVVDVFGAAWDVVLAVFQAIADAVSPVIEFLGQTQEKMDALNRSLANTALADAVKFWGQFGVIIQALAAPLGAVAGFSAKLAETFPAMAKGNDDANQKLGQMYDRVHDVLSANFPDTIKAWDEWLQTLKRDTDAVTTALTNFWAALTGGGKQGTPPAHVTGAQISSELGPNVQGGNLPDFAGGKGKGGKEQMTEWENQLRQMEMQTRQDTGEWLADLKQMEADFWSDKLASLSTKSKEYQEVLARSQQANLAVQQDAGRAQLDADKVIISEKKSNWDQEIVALNKLMFDTMRLYGDNAKEVGQVWKQMEDAQRAHDNQMASEAAKAAQEVAKQQIEGSRQALAMQRIAFEEEQTMSSVAASLGVIKEREAFNQKLVILQQEQDAQVAAANAQYEAQKQALDKEAQAYVQSGNVAKFWEMISQIQALARQHGQQMALIGAQGAQQWLNAWTQRLQELQQKFHSFVDPIVQSWGSAMQGLIWKTESWHDAVIQIGQAVTQTLIDAGEKWLEAQIVNWLIAKTGQGAQALGQIQSNAAIAASAAYAATAGIPFIGPALAPEAASAAFAGAEAWSALAVPAAAEGFDVPWNQDPLTQLHHEEMVLPSGLANTVRDIASGGGGGGGGVGQVGGGDTHNWSVQALDPANFERYLRRNKGTLTKIIGESVRENGAVRMLSGRPR